LTVLRSENGTVLVGGFDKKVTIYDQNFSIINILQLDDYLRAGIVVNYLAFLSIWNKSILVYNIEKPGILNVIYLNETTLKFILDSSNNLICA
jgi:hypothetical protein